jgi:hypothetical protein
MTVREALTQQNPGALFYPDRYDAALVGMTLGFRGPSETKPVGVYDHGKLIGILAAEFLGYVHEDINEARRFGLEFKDKSYSIVDSHLIEVSRSFPAAVFLLEYFDTQASYSGKRVIRAGEIVQEVFDGNQQVQGLDWSLLDIFAPFRAEYYGEEHEFGSLWTSWVEAIVAAAKALKDEQDSALLRSDSGSGRHEELSDPRVGT